MKKTLTFLIVFCLFLYPQRDGVAQKEPVKDVKVLSAKDSLVTQKIDSQMTTVQDEINRIRQIIEKKPDQVVRFKTRYKHSVRIDSFFVYVDTCYGKVNILQYPEPDTVWMMRNKPTLKEIINGIFGKKNKKKRAGEIKIIRQ